MRHSLIALLLLSLLVTPARAQVGPQLTQSSVAGGGGVSSQGPLRVEGVIGQSSAGTSSGGSFTLHGGFFAPGAGPSVLSVASASANPTVQNTTVGYNVTFDVPVTGVDAADFQLTTASLSGASVTGVTGSGTTYGVTVNTGTPSAAGATLRLDVIDDDTITDAGGDPLGGAGAGNGNFTSGEVYTVNPISARANDARTTEPTTATTPLLFTVTLTAPATGPLSVNYATADGGANPAAGGASCGGATDYESASGTLNFAAGEQVKTVSVGVCADTSAGESAETLLLNLSGATGGDIQRAQATGTILQGTAVSAVLISELRTSGPNGTGDDFVELYNNSDFDQDISGFGVFKMGASCADTPVLVGTVPGAVGSNTTVLQGRGHYLLVGSQYGLGGYAAGDLVMTSDIESDRNVAVFSTADVGNLSSITRYDAVGFGTNAGGGVCDLFREGNTLAPASGSTLQHTFFRKQCDFVGAVGCTAGGNPKDTDNNAADFLFADTMGSPVAGLTQRLGVPGPENRTSPVRRDTSGVFATLLDSTKSSSVEPNRHRDFTAVPNGSFGTLSIRRRVTNVTGQPVTRLRVRIIEMTTFPVGAAGEADMRAISSSAVSVMSINDAGTCSPAAAPCTLTIEGTTLESPPEQSAGGGYNSTLAAETVTLATPLANNAAVNLQFVLGIEQPGKFRFYIIVEALP
jgi:hypothetical protein